MTLPPIPETTLRATYAREQPHRHNWPKDYETGMQDPIIARIVDMMARRQVPAFGRRKAGRLGPVLKAKAAINGYGEVLAPGEIDRKRAASGDKDDETTD